MNIVAITGRLVSDPELRKAGEYDVCNFKVAAGIPGPGEKAAFIDCMAWGGLAKVVAQYGKKGDLVEVAGHLVTGSYGEGAAKRYFTKVNAQNYRLMHKSGTDTRVPELGDFSALGVESEDTL